MNNVDPTIKFTAKRLRDLANKADYAPDIDDDGSDPRFLVFPITEAGLAELLHQAADLIDPQDRSRDGIEYVAK